MRWCMWQPSEICSRLSNTLSGRRSLQHERDGAATTAGWCGDRHAAAAATAACTARSMHAALCQQHAQHGNVFASTSRRTPSASHRM